MATRATRPWAWLPIRATAALIQDSLAASRNTRISASPGSPRSRSRYWSIERLEGARATVYYSENWLRSTGLLPWAELLVRSLDDDRKGAAEVNRDLLDWLAHRSHPERPFFAFLNYYDAHYPYQLPPGRFHRFGVEATDPHERLLIQQWGVLDKKTVSPSGVAFAAAAYDDCIADLDEQLGKLFDELSQSGVLDRTWLIVTADHGESFGEHAGIFCHGTSLYDTEVHVPLLVISPGGARGRAVGQRGGQFARAGGDNR